jgi:two-component sensor histidine kinase
LSAPVLKASSVVASEVFISSELALRQPKKTDYLSEKLALQELAARMVDDPSQVLPRFVELAMQMTGGISAGLSLYEENPAPGIFRWHHLCGSLAAFDGATTPRNDSPCGVTLDQAVPVLTRHSERLYSWISDANIVVPEVLLVPLFLGGPEPLGTLWVVSNEEGHFDSGHARVATELATFVGIALRMQRNEERLRTAFEAQELLTLEMNHRLKNIFALADTMVRFSARGAASKEEMAVALSDRLHALAKAHTLVLAGGADPTARQPLDLAVLIHTIVRPHETGAGEASRFSIEGGPFTCSEQAVTGLALVIHELATNAAKYGALVSDTGRVEVTWLREQDHLVLRWAESGGPAIAAPNAAGFGTKLIHGTIVGQFGGSVEHQWQPDGLTVLMRLPFDALAQKATPAARAS